MTNAMTAALWLRHGTEPHAIAAAPWLKFARSATTLLGAMLAAAAVVAAPAPEAVGDPLGWHHTPLRQIDHSNVAQLAPAWVHRSGDQAADPDGLRNSAGQSTPVLLPAAAGESLVYCTPFNRVIALDPGSGMVRWQHDPHIVRGSKRPFRCRGVAYAQVAADDATACAHRLYSLTGDRRLIALDARNGQPCAGFGDHGTVRLADHGLGSDEVSSSSAPLVANGVVVVGSSVVDFLRTVTPRGIVAAYDAVTGAPRWVFDPLAGLDGTGAANVWAPLAADAGRDLVFLPTSAPSPDYWGVNRPGRNGDANAIVALRLSTGARVWSRQFVHHDLWDYDLPAQPVLFDWHGPSGAVPALAQLTKQGFVFVLDRRDGTPLFPIEERAVPASRVPGEAAWPTQPFVSRPPPLLKLHLSADDAWGLTFWDRGKCRERLAALRADGLFTPPDEQGTLLYPGSLGGANWGGGAWWPTHNRLIVNINTMPFFARLVASTADESAGDHPRAGKVMSVTMQGTPYTVQLGAVTSPLGMPCIAPPWGELVAIDLARGEIDWRVPLGSVHEMGPLTMPFRIDWGTPNLGGGLVTDSGLFFIGATMDRLFRAFDASTGREVWHFRLPVDATATPMSYVYRGRQYIVINAGGHAMFGRGVGDWLYAFALPGTP